MCPGDVWNSVTSLHRRPQVTSSLQFLHKAPRLMQSAFLHPYQHPVHLSSSLEGRVFAETSFFTPVNAHSGRIQHLNRRGSACWFEPRDTTAPHQLLLHYCQTDTQRLKRRPKPAAQREWNSHHAVWSDLFTKKNFQVRQTFSWIIGWRSWEK